MTAIDEVVAPNSLIEQALSGFEALDRANCGSARAHRARILEGMHTIIEAGTGVDKSLAYLVPTLRSRRRSSFRPGTVGVARAETPS